MIFHAKKPNGFVMVDKAALNDPRISLKAKGLLCYLLSKPPDWRPQIEDICKHCRERASAVRSAFRELAKFGYAKLIRQSVAGGRWEGSFWTIHEKPESSEIAVFRISEKRNLKVLRITENKNEERVLRDFPLSESDKALGITKERLIKENAELIDRLLVGNTNDNFIAQWRKRSEKSPFRTQVALAFLLDEISGQCQEIENRGGFANRIYLNSKNVSKSL